MKTFRFFEDSGHGWLEVEFKDLVNLGVENEISRYSYRSGDYVYLEEDCDFTWFARKYKHLYGEYPEYTTLYYDGECFIKDLPSYYVYTVVMNS